MAIKTHDKEARDTAIVLRVMDILKNIQFGTDFKIEIKAEMGDAVKIRYDVGEIIREDNINPCMSIFKAMNEGGNT